MWNQKSSLAINKKKRREKTRHHRVLLFAHRHIPPHMQTFEKKNHQTSLSGLVLPHRPTATVDAKINAGASGSCTRESLRNYWHPPFPNENERLIHQLEIQLSQGVPCRGRVLLHAVWTKTGRKGKHSTFERNLNVALTPSSTSFLVKTAIPCMLSLNFENRGE